MGLADLGSVIRSAGGLSVQFEEEGDMRVLSIALAMTLYGVISAASAQQALTGKYSGHLEVTPPGMASPVRVALELNIAAVNGNTVTGTLLRHARVCGGTQPITGTLNGEKLRVATAKTESQVLGCQMAFDLTITGAKLIGVTGTGSPIEFTK